RLSEAKDVTELLMMFFLYSSQYFQRAVTQLDVERNSLDQKLSDDINNKDLVELSNIEKSLVYLSSSIQTDLMMLH
ncbi:magnesium transporter CorA family protein, partial [Salmonella enterica subsp. enterica serovar Enteritidis]|nr:magnesium transporter CorA family protein [Salmonella enterica subsp. enterica serovar Enteritidis]